MLSEAPRHYCSCLSIVPNLGINLLGHWLYRATWLQIQSICKSEGNGSDRNLLCGTGTYFGCEHNDRNWVYCLWRHNNVSLVVYSLLCISNEELDQNPLMTYEPIGESNVTEQTTYGSTETRACDSSARRSDDIQLNSYRWKWDKTLNFIRGHHFVVITPLRGFSTTPLSN